MAEEKVPEKQGPSSGSLTGDSYAAEDVFENAEPWDPIETKVVIWSFVVAIICLVIFGYLINVYLLH